MPDVNGYETAQSQIASSLISWASQDGTLWSLLRISQEQAQHRQLNWWEVVSILDRALVGYPREPWTFLLPSGPKKKKKPQPRKRGTGVVKGKRKSAKLSRGKSVSRSRTRSLSDLEQSEDNRMITFDRFL